MSVPLTLYSLIVNSCAPQSMSGNESRREARQREGGALIATPPPGEEEEEEDKEVAAINLSVEQRAKSSLL